MRLQNVRDFRFWSEAYVLTAAADVCFRGSNRLALDADANGLGGLVIE